MSNQYLDPTFLRLFEEEQPSAFFWPAHEVSVGLTQACGHDYQISQLPSDFPALWLDLDGTKPQGFVAGQGRFVVPKGVEMNSRITSAVLCPIEQVSAEGLAQSFTPVVGVNDYAAQNACLFFFSYDVRIAQEFAFLVQRSE